MQVFIISDNFSGRRDIVLFAISTIIPRHVAALVGGN